MHYPARRHVVAGFGALALGASSAGLARALDAADFGLVADSDADQTAALHAASTAARDSGQRLAIPPGRFMVKNLELFGNIVIEGTPGRTTLVALDGQPAAIAHGFKGVVLRHLDFRSELRPGSDAPPGLLVVRAGASAIVEQCAFNHAGVGILVEGASVTVSDCELSYLDDAAIHALDSTGLVIRNNRIDTCGNAGIRIWRSASGPDGSIITGNRIANIDWRAGGNGQNGNGINVFKADEVIIANNHVADCAFTAVRLNSTNNTQVSGNTCLRSGEVAIFSEFAFSGSIIANNIVDGAAAGISMTNFDQGGQLAVCTGNIVRNIAPNSRVNPDTTPYGIFAEADAAITGNTVQKVPGTGIGAGNGPYLRNVIIASNVISGTAMGIAVSVVDGAGKVHIADNLIHDSGLAIAGMAWRDVVEPDLATNASRYPNVTLGS